MTDDDSFLDSELLAMSAEVHETAANVVWTSTPAKRAEWANNFRRLTPQLRFLVFNAIACQPSVVFSLLRDFRGTVRTI